MQRLLYYNLSTGVLSADGTGQAVVWPAWIQGDDQTLAFRFLEDLAGTTVAASRSVTSLKASLGLVDARPAWGTFNLKVGSATSTPGVNVTAAIQFNQAAPDLATILNALSGGFAAGQSPARCYFINGSWLVHAANDTQLFLSASGNTLRPFSFVTINEYQSEGKWISEIRLVQTPVAFTDAFALILPPPPSIARLQAGGADDVNKWDEIQTLTVPPSFLGTYQITRGFAKSALLSTSDGPDELTAALAPLADTGGTFIVTNPSNFQFNIEFSGTMGGQGQSLLGVTVFNAPPGDPTLTLSLNRPALAAALRAKSPAALTLEIEAIVEDVTNSETLHTLTLVQGPVNVAAQTIDPSIATDQDINWAIPLSWKDYVPFGADNVLTGLQNYRASFGDGAATTFAFHHSLDCEDLVISVRENTSGGKLLRDGTDYNVIFTDADNLALTLLGTYSATPPASGALRVIIVSAATVTQFASGLTVTEAQVINLAADLAAIGANLTTLNAAIGITGGGSTAQVVTPAQVAVFQLEKLWELVPPPRSFTVAAPATLSALDLTKLPRARALLPAVHSLTSAALTIPLPSSGTIGTIYQNTSGSPVELPADFGHAAASLPANGYCAWDGRMWYVVSQYAEDTATASATPFTVTASSNNITIPSSPFPVGARVRVASTGTLPPPLAINTDYYIGGAGAILLDAPGGAAIYFTGLGSGTHSIFYPAKSSWYPSAFDVTLFERIVSDKILAVNRSLILQLGLELAILKGNSRAVWTLVIEWGVLEQDTAPSRTAFNLKDYAWNATPILEVPILLDGGSCTHSFGIIINRALTIVDGSPVDTITASQIIYGAQSSGGSAPSNANFALRARLIRFDTEDANAAPVGLAAVLGPDRSGGADSSVPGGSLGQMIIQQSGA